jgi:hypothetical protein
MEPIPPSSRAQAQAQARLPKPDFNPEQVTRMVFRWTPTMLEFGEVIGMNPCPNGVYVFSSDYDKLLDLYRALKLGG